jgi:hypothetical protein
MSCQHENADAPEDACGQYIFGLAVILSDEGRIKRKEMVCHPQEVQTNDGNQEIDHGSKPE